MTSSGHLEGILIELNKAVKAYSFYPPTHPSLKNILSDTYKQSIEAIRKFGNITYEIRREGIFHQDRQLFKTGLMKTLSNDLYHKRIKSITMTPNMTIEDWGALIDILNTSSNEVVEKGGAEKILSGKGVKGIWLNEINYEEIVDKAGDDLPEEDETGTEEYELEKEDDVIDVDELLNDLGEMVDPAELDGERDEVREELEDILKTLEETYDPVRYEELVRMLVGRAMVLKEEEDRGWDKVIMILHAFSRHAKEDSGRPESIRMSADQGFKEIFDRDFLEMCVNRVCIKGEERHEEIADIIIHSGRHSVPYLLGRLIEEEDIYARRTLFTIVVRLGNASKQEVERSLIESDNWIVKRQMISILGAIGSPDSVKALKQTLKFNDIRVRKEVIKALTSIRSKEAIEELGKLVSAKDNRLALQAILSLGAIKATQSVPSLIAITMAKGLGSGIYEKKKEAIKALGNIGDKRALKPLIEILLRTKWFRRKRYEELRILSAQSIGKIGGEDAVKVLSYMLKRSKGELSLTCQRALGALGVNPVQD